MSVLRLVTVHPLLVHLTIGLVPLMIVAYVLARALGSDRWVFVADVTLYVTAVVTIATAAFGLASFFKLPWPGGLSPWSWLHLGFGVATAVLLLCFAGFRLGNRKHKPHGSAATILASLATGGFVAFTGWIGGEVLVYRSGMAVIAAGDGALAPPLGATSTAAPVRFESLVDAMGALRGQWAAIETGQAHMIVDHPDDRSFDQIALHAHRIAQLAAWMVQRANARRPAPRPPASAAVPEPVAPVPAAPAPGAPATPPQDRAAHMAELASDLGSGADAVADAAASRDLPAVVAASARVGAACAHCHVEMRWHEDER